MIGPLAYIGGKSRLARTIIPLLPPHQTYIEPMAGGAQVFFRKPPSPVEVLNDLDNEVFNFLRICQSHHEELVRHLRYLVVSRSWFRLLQATEPATLTDVQRAARFFFLQKNAFGGKRTEQNYHYSIANRPNFRPERIPEVLAAAHERLRGVQLECLPYEQVLAKYDRPTSVFYLDPPYWNRKLYRFNFTEEDFQKLAQRLRGLKGKFLLSLDDHPKVRETFREFPRQAVELVYTAQPRPGRRYRELLISNYLPASNSAATDGPAP